MSEQHVPIVSTGRGGHGNIGRDPTVYTDGGIIRESVTGESEREEYSTGRGGAGNIGSPRLRAQPGRGAEDVIPEVSTVVVAEDVDQVFHTGRGGGGNIRRIISNTKETPEGAAQPAARKSLERSTSPSLTEKVRGFFRGKKEETA